MPDLIPTLLFPSNIYQSAKFCLFVFLSFLYVYLHSDDNADNDGDDDDSDDNGDDDSDGADDGVSDDHSKNGDFSDENIVVYDKNDNNDNDGDDDDYDVVDNSQSPQLFSALSVSLLFMI